MIKSKDELIQYLEQDKIALGRSNQKHPKFGRDEIWRFQILLRKAEYYTNCKKSFLSYIPYIYYKYKFHRMSVKLNFSIPLNVFDEGLCIVHYGTIVVNSNSKIGKNCRIQESVTIGTSGGSDKAPIIGNNVFIASGARIIGDITIGNNVAIGANAVVTKSFSDNHLTLAGVPAKVISHNGSDSFIVKELIS